MLRSAVRSIALVALLAGTATAQRTVKPVLHGRHWVAITGKPLAATAGAMIFQRGGNAVDATCAMPPPSPRCGMCSHGVGTIATTLPRTSSPR